MEPRHDEQNQAPPRGAAQKPKRFRIVKLEERIAPSKAGTNGKSTCACYSNDCAYATGLPCW
jgi:hypothetical protein